MSLFFIVLHTYAETISCEGVSGPLTVSSEDKVLDTYIFWTLLCILDAYLKIRIVQHRSTIIADQLVNISPNNKSPREYSYRT